MNNADNPKDALIQSFKIPTQYKNYILFKGRVIIRFTDQSSFYYLVCLIIKSNQMKKRRYIIIAIIILFLLYLWAELGVGIFFQDSWGGDQITLAFMQGFFYCLYLPKNFIIIDI